MTAPGPTRSLGRATLAAAVAGSLVALVAWSSIEGDLVLGLIAAAIIGVAVLLGLVHVVIGVSRRTVPTSTIVAAGVVIITGILISTGIPFAVRWAASESAFTAYARLLPPTTASPTAADFPGECPDRLGLFRLKGRYPACQTYLFTDRTGTFLGSSGFAQRPAGAPLTISDGDIFVTFTVIGGGWCSFTREYG